MKIHVAYYVFNLPGKHKKRKKKFYTHWPALGPEPGPILDLYMRRCTRSSAASWGHRQPSWPMSQLFKKPGPCPTYNYQRDMLGLGKALVSDSERGFANSPQPVRWVRAHRRHRPCRHGQARVQKEPSQSLWSGSELCAAPTLPRLWTSRGMSAFPSPRACLPATEDSEQPLQAWEVIPSG